MEIRSINHALRTTDTEQLGESMEKRGFTGRVWTDHGSDICA
jgi:hypothetical protein